MNGNQSLEKIDEFIGLYHDSVGLSDKNNEAIKLLEIKSEELKSFNSQLANEAALTLSSFAFHIQKEANKINARIKGLNYKINEIIVKRLGQQKAYSFEEKKMLATKEDSVASELNALRVKEEMKIESIVFLAQRIDNQANMFVELAKTLNKKGIL